jgi:predicted DCC family thiol-disulfide oxidoreductase YuxK
VAQSSKLTASKIILFDGVCNLCNDSINFVIRHDKANHFLFAPLQSTAAQQLEQEYHFDRSALSSFVLIEEGQVYYRSTAALRVLRRLPLPWKLGYAFIIIPAFLRNGVYNWIARNRYRWFGKRETCMVPTPALLNKFLD